MPSRTITRQDVARLRSALRGPVITADDAGYDEARRVWNGLHDQHPGALVRPSDASEVATALRLGREWDVEIALRSGAHSPTGHSTTEGGLVIDLAGMRGVSVDPTARTARANGGALLGELDVAAQAHGLVCPVGVIGHTGVAGLTLGGGVGRLQRRFGLTIDSLRAVELVTADGRLVRASETEEPDLFWAMRGAGANFGIVTSFELALHPFGGVLHRGTRVYRASDAQAVWANLRDRAGDLPEALTCILAIGRAEPGEGYPDEVTGQAIVVVGYSHGGDAADVERDTAGLKAGPKPIAVREVSLPYLEVQTAHDLVLGFGHRSIIESAYANGVRPAAIDALVAHAAEAPVGASFSITVQGGAIARVADEAMAYTGRAASFDLSADGSWDDPALDTANTVWIDRAMEIVAPDFTVGPDCSLGRYVNGCTRAGPEQVRAIYGDAKLERLRALKHAWDPDNVFRLNFNIEPAA
jgi:FAD/FMN-containing dehydrogenase